MQNEFKYNINSVTQDELLDFLIEVNNDFSPKLSERVNLKDWVKKMSDNATTFEVWDNDKLIAMIVAYINDYQTKQAYVTLVCCKKEYRRRGIIENMFKRVFEYCINKSFETIVLKTDINNIPAINLYKKLNFVETEDTNHAKIKFIKRINNEKS